MRDNNLPVLHLSRCLELDRWDAMGLKSHHSSSATDLFSLLFIMTERFFSSLAGMLPHGAQQLMSFVQLLNQGVVNYARAVCATCGHVSELLPSQQDRLKSVSHLDTVSMAKKARVAISMPFAKRQTTIASPASKSGTENSSNQRASPSAQSAGGSSNDVPQDEQALSPLQVETVKSLW